MTTATLEDTKQGSFVVSENSNQTFSANYVINAYNQGKEDKVLEIETRAKTQFQKNRSYTIESVNKIIFQLIQNKIIPTGGWIKEEGLDVFEAIIGIPEKSYHSSDFDKFYVISNQIESTSNNPDYHLNIRFINGDRSINEEKLLLDGYRLRFLLQVHDKQKPIKK